MLFLCTNDLTKPFALPTTRDKGFFPVGVSNGSEAGGKPCCAARGVKSPSKYALSMLVSMISTMEAHGELSGVSTEEDVELLEEATEDRVDAAPVGSSRARCVLVMSTSEGQGDLRRDSPSS